MARTLLIILAVFATSLPGQESQAEFFGLDKIWDIHIEVARADWVRMFPSGKRTATRLFGKYPYQTCDVTIGSHTLKGVAIRMKGNATFAANGGTLKKSLKLDFNRSAGKRKFLGMGKLNLQCNALDRTQIKEAVSYHIYRSCGVVAGRTCFARVFVTMTGELKRAYIGLYTVVEQVDQRFARRTMGGGLILKPDAETLIYLGATWNDEYERAYHAKSTVTDELTQPLIATAALFDEPPGGPGDRSGEEVFAKGIEAVMDIESFLRYTAATAILINTDSPLTVPDNYYLIVSKKTRKVTWVPWDMNWSMGEYGRITNTPTVDLSIMQPTQKEVFRRVLEVPRFQQRYREIATGFIDGPCSAAAMTAAIRRANKTVAAALAEEANREKAVTQAVVELGGRPSRHPLLQGRSGDNLAGLLAFAKAREQSVEDQLAGKSVGRSARNVFGPNARSVRGTNVRNIFSGTGVLDGSKTTFDREAIDTAMAACFPRVDTDESMTLDTREFTAILRRRWNSLPRESRRGRDISPARGRRALSLLDADGSGAVDPGEWRTGIRALLRYWDRDSDGRWSREELNVVTKTKK